MKSLILFCMCASAVLAAPSPNQQQQQQHELDQLQDVQRRLQTLSVKVVSDDDNDGRYDRRDDRDRHNIETDDRYDDWYKKEERVRDDRDRTDSYRNNDDIKDRRDERDRYDRDRNDDDIKDRRDERVRYDRDRHDDRREETSNDDRREERTDRQDENPIRDDRQEKRGDDRRYRYDRREDRGDTYDRREVRDRVDRYERRERYDDRDGHDDQDRQDQYREDERYYNRRDDDQESGSDDEDDRRDNHEDQDRENPAGPNQDDRYDHAVEYQRTGHDTLRSSNLNALARQMDYVSTQYGSQGRVKVVYIPPNQKSSMSYHDLGSLNFRYMPSRSNEVQVRESYVKPMVLYSRPAEELQKRPRIDLEQLQALSYNPYLRKPQLNDRSGDDDDVSE